MRASGVRSWLTLVAVAIAGCRGETASRELAASTASDELRRRGEVASRVRSTLEESIYFDFDRAHVRPNARRILEAKIGLLKSDPSIRLTIEGHADSRGMDTYNEVLAWQRARAVHDVFTRAGIDSLRLEVRSFGERRPAAPGHDEWSWSRNRRAEFQVLAGRSVQW